MRFIIYLNAHSVKQHRKTHNLFVCLFIDSEPRSTLATSMWHIVAVTNNHEVNHVSVELIAFYKVILVKPHLQHWTEKKKQQTTIHLFPFSLFLCVQLFIDCRCGRVFIGWVIGCVKLNNILVMLYSNNNRARCTHANNIQIKYWSELVGQRLQCQNRTANELCHSVKNCRPNSNM